MTRRRGVLLATLPALAVAALIGAGALGPADGTVAVRPAEHATDAEALAAIRPWMTEAELVDVRRMAEQDGIPVGEAITRFGWHNAFAGLATSIEERHPAEFAGAGIDRSEDQLAWIAFKGEVPPGAGRDIAAFPFAHVRVETGSGYSQAEKEERVTTVHMAFAQRDDLVADIVSHADSAGTVVVAVEPVRAEATTDSSLAADLRRELLSGLPPAGRGWPVRIVLRAHLGGGLEGADVADLAGAE